MNKAYYFINFFHKSFAESEGFRMSLFVLMSGFLAIAILTVGFFGFVLIKQQLNILESQTENTKILGKTFEILIEKSKPKNADFEMDSIRLQIQKTNY